MTPHGTRERRGSAAAGRRRTDVAGRRQTDRHPFTLTDLTVLLGDAAGLAHTVQCVAEYAVDAFSNVDGAGVRIVGEDAMTVVSGIPATQLAEDLHDKLLEGPAIEAFTQGRVIWCGSLGAAETWRRFGPRVARLGLHSALAIPLFLDSSPVGVVTVYSKCKHAFTVADAEIAQRYAAPTAALMHNARQRDRDARLAAQLTEAMQSRPPIDQAIGIMMSRTAKSPEQALDSLRRLSNERHVKVATLARQIVDEAVRRARQRRIAGNDGLSP